MTRPVLLLEFDDLLVGTRAVRFAALREALRADGVTLDEDGFDARCAGLTLDEAVRAAARGTPLELDETGLELAARRAEALQSSVASRGLALMPGIADFVRHASSRAVIGLVAAQSRSAVMQLLELAGLTDHFSHVGCEDDGGPRATLAERWQGVRRRLLARVAIQDVPTAIIALCGTGAGIEAARGPGVRVFAAGAIAAPIAFRSDGWIPTLEQVTLSELLAMEAHSE
jgi:beta-phosphoglucomutase-like phosphatase (HAD superfamily)